MSRVIVLGARSARAVNGRAARSCGRVGLVGEELQSAHGSAVRPLFTIGFVRRLCVLVCVLAGCLLGAVAQAGASQILNPGPALVDSGHYLTSAACSSGTQCTAVDTVGREVTFDPTTGLANGAGVNTVDSGQGLNAVACSSGTQCTAVDGNGGEVTFDPTTGLVNGAGMNIVENVAGLVSVACSSGTQCTAVDGNGDEVTFDPTSGIVNGAGLNTVDSYGLSSVACSSGTQCTAVDYGGREVTFDPATGIVNGVGVSAIDSYYLYSVACSSGTQCTAVEWGSREVTFDPTSGIVNGAGVNTVDSGQNLISVACSSGTQCTAVDGNGGEVTFDPTSGIVNGAGVNAVDSGQALNAVACSSGTQCTAVDGNGDEVTFDPTVVKASPSIGTSQRPASKTVGGSISDQATVAGGDTPTGTVTFNLYNNSNGTGAPLFTDANVPLSGGSATSAGYATTATGTDYWVATYNGDSTNHAVTSATADEPVTINAASPSLSASASSSGTAGSAISASAISGVLSGGYSPSGTITFRVFGPQSRAPTSCSSGGATVGTASVSGNGTYNPSASFTPSSAGDYWWYASNGEDANNNAAASTCSGSMAETVVGPASPRLSVSAPASGTAGAAISTSSISGVLSGGSRPSGAITFEVFGPQSSAPSSCSGGRRVATANVSGSGTYSPATGFTPGRVGDYWWYAGYGGDASNSAAVSTCGALMAETVVAQGSQTVAFTSIAPAGATVGGQSYTPTATGGGSGNPVLFSVDASTTNSACSINNSGVVSFAHAGSCVIDANQAGDSDYTAATEVQQTFTVPAEVSTPPAAPQNTGAPLITGPVSAESTVSCSPGTWSSSPTAFAYQWNRDGTPIAGANTSSHLVQRIDQGNTLTCTVIASNGAQSAPATSAGLLITVPRVAGCPAATGTVTRTQLGLFTLGETRSQAEQADPHSSTRGSRYLEAFCLTPIGVRVGYGSPTLTAALSRSLRHTIAHRIVWISTASAHYAIGRIRPGATVTAASTKLLLGKAFVVGANDWYLSPHGPVTAIFKARHGIIEEIGIADAQVTHGRAAQRKFLTSFH